MKEDCSARLMLGGPGSPSRGRNGAEWARASEPKRSVAKGLLAFLLLLKPRVSKKGGNEMRDPHPPLPPAKSVAGMAALLVKSSPWTWRVCGRNEGMKEGRKEGGSIPALLKDAVCLR